MEPAHASLKFGSARPVEDPVFRELLAERELQHAQLRDKLVDCLRLHLEAHRAYRRRLGQYACLRAVKQAVALTEVLLGEDEVREILARPED